MAARQPTERFVLPWIQIDSAKAPGGGELRLMRRSDEFSITIGGNDAGYVPLLFAALGEMVSEQAGVLNIGIEGTMLVGAYVGFVAAEKDGAFLIDIRYMK